MTYLHWLALLSLAFVVAERLRPRQQRPWLRRGIGTDLTYLMFNAHFLGLLATALGAGLAVRVDAVLPWHGLASAWHTGVQFAVALLGVDLFHWCVHNLLHRVPFLWRFHQVHHSIEDMDWIGSFRFHWVEGLFYKAMTYPVLAVLGFAPEVLMALAVVGTAVGHFNHSNLAVSLGPLRYVLNSPQMHVWHHATPDEAPLCNFGITLSLWDWLFGTAWLPETDPRRIGLEAPIARTFLGQLLHPLRLPRGWPVVLVGCHPSPSVAPQGCDGLEIVAGTPGQRRVRRRWPRGGRHLPVLSTGRDGRH